MRFPILIPLFVLPHNKVHSMKKHHISSRHFSALVAYALSTFLLISSGCKKDEATSNHLEAPFLCEVESSSGLEPNTSEYKRSYDLILATNVEGDEIQVLDYVFIIESEDQTSFTAIDPITREKQTAVLSFQNQFNSISITDNAKMDNGITWEYNLQGEFITSPLSNRLRDMNGTYTVKADFFNDGFAALQEIDTVFEASMPLEIRPSGIPENPRNSVFIGEDGYSTSSVFFSRYFEELGNSAENSHSMIQIKAGENSLHLLFEASGDDMSGEVPISYQVRKSYHCSR